MPRNDEKDRKRHKVWMGNRRSRRRRTIGGLALCLFLLGVGMLYGTIGRFDMVIFSLSVFGASLTAVCFIVLYPFLEKHLSAIETMTAHRRVPAEGDPGDKQGRSRLALNLCIYGTLGLFICLSILGCSFFIGGNMLGCYTCYALAGHVLVIGIVGGWLSYIEVRLRGIVGNLHSEGSMPLGDDAKKGCAGPEDTGAASDVGD